MTNNIDDILAFINKEDPSSVDSTEGYKSNNLFDREQMRLLKLDCLISKKVTNMQHHPQADHIIKQQTTQKDSYLKLLKKILITNGMVSETKIASVWNSLFFKN